MLRNSPDQKSYTGTAPGKNVHTPISATAPAATGNSGEKKNNPMRISPEGTSVPESIYLIQTKARPLGGVLLFYSGIEYETCV
jgi:hypothetical protein